MRVIAERRTGSVFTVAHRDPLFFVHLELEREMRGPFMGAVTPGLVLGFTTLTPEISPGLQTKDPSLMPVVAKWWFPGVLAGTKSILLLLTNGEFDRLVFRTLMGTVA